MFTSTPSLAGTKRDVGNVTEHCQTTGSALPGEHQAGAVGHVDPQTLCCTSCCPDPSPRDAADGSRPSKRRKGSATEPVTISSDQQFPDICFEQFCQDCGELDAASCTSPCPVPCPGDDGCDGDDACWDPNCDQTPQCADECVDPECKKLTCPNDPCFCQKCGVQPCPLGDVNSECHQAHTAPTATGTIYCFDNAPCHFQEGRHLGNIGLDAYEGYPCFSQNHSATTDLRDRTAQPSSLSTPVLSPSNYTSLESAFSSQSSPAPGQTSAAPHCFLNIPDDHCHIGHSCCHGPSRACADFSTAPQENFDIWKLSLGHDNAFGGANPYSNLNFGLHTSQPSTMSLDQALSSNTTPLDHSMQTQMFDFNNSSWMLPDAQQFNMLQNPVSGHVNKLDYLASAVQADAMNLISPISSATPGFSFPTTSDIPSDSSSANVCKWQLGPNMICHQVFDTAEALHKHVKSAHVDHCTRCFCQWQGCESSEKDFKQRSKLSRHLLGHAGYRPYACSFKGCNKTFATNQAKDNHERTHTGDRPYVCDRCGYTTTTHTQLQTHISALHLNQKPHKCRFCDFTCADSSNLSKHERTHQTLRPYRCPHPACTFKPDCRWENLKRHLRRSGHCPELLQEGSQEYKDYREGVRREIDDWHRRNEGGTGIVGSRRRGGSVAVSVKSG
ncbi:hypothetical protein BU24DRAFT_363839 [Aaosphaeria arxii CBS 175.79]|uniref:C2H2-type domain-containing protein n=1 Tax=Aaosphaeria arxii CBS 175.79 TaxID=1450172 RepID=A0A6A5Y121_9PLEO|nr:uncharacterized protein BU24DRAFT_363839 [Aaosphaeria arxii CBS 175.79]KAF2018611.1 hypothetical protein BU24DRAFT_363839 [Aaosphaeria arxii CBS 175.79]